MKKIIVSLFIASSLFVGAPLPAMAGVDVAAACDGAVPDAWKRPGGYCDQNDFGRSLSGPTDAGCTPLVIGMNGSDRETRLLLATSGAGCCTMETNFKFDPSKSRVIVADYDPCRDRCASLGSDFFDADKRDRVLLVAC